MTGVIFQVWAALLINSRFLRELLSNKTVKLSSSVRKKYVLQNMVASTMWLGSHT